MQTSNHVLPYQQKYLIQPSITLKVLQIEVYKWMIV